MRLCSERVDSDNDDGTHDGDHTNDHSKTDQEPLIIILILRENLEYKA